MAEISPSAMLRLSAQQSLLGALPASIVGIAVLLRHGTLTMTAFSEDEMSSDDRETLDVALTEVAADFPEVSHANLVPRVANTGLLDAEGEWVILRSGFYSTRAK